MRIGLLGGSFNPPHEGHVHISLIAMKILKLDAVWWMVTPDHPLKPAEGVASVEQRAAWSDVLIRHPRIVVNSIELDLGTSITYDTVTALSRHFPRTKFCFITGMDNALTLHRWNKWRGILKKVCMVHIVRPPALSLIRSCPLRMMHRQNHVVPGGAARYPLTPGTTYWIMQKKMIDMSSTALRNKGDKSRG